MDCAQVNYSGLRALLKRGAQLVEVLPRDDYAKLHIPGAVNIPLRRLDSERAGELDRGSPIVTYCWDSL